MSSPPRLSILKAEDSPAPPSPMKRTVTWHEDTPEPTPTHLAVSIPRAKNMKSPPHTLYVIELWQDGRSWTIKRRYSEFHEFHRKLIEEDWLNPDYVPELPGKRWFYIKRWFNRFDEDFTKERRFALQEYLRSILKLNIVLERSFALQQFLEINKTKLNAGGRLAVGDDDHDGRSSDLSVAESVEGGRRSIFHPDQAITVKEDFMDHSDV